MRKFNQIELVTTDPVYAENEVVLSYIESVTGGKGNLESLPQFGAMKKRVDRMAVVEAEAYHSLVSFMVSHLNTENLHWFYTASTIGLLEIVLRPEMPISADLMSAVINRGILSDIRAGTRFQNSYETLSPKCFHITLEKNLHVHQATLAKESKNFSSG